MCMMLGGLMILDVRLEQVGSYSPHLHGVDTEAPLSAREDEAQLQRQQPGSKAQVQGVIKWCRPAICLSQLQLHLQVAPCSCCCIINGFGSGPN